ncbi:PAS domain S-box protein [bacterium]|nr:PAS domain S-box protein [bacterium]
MGYVRLINLVQKKRIEEQDCILGNIIINTFLSHESVNQYGVELISISDSGINIKDTYTISTTYLQTENNQSQVFVSAHVEQEMEKKDIEQNSLNLRKSMADFSNFAYLLIDEIGIVHYSNETAQKMLGIGELGEIDREVLLELEQVFNRVKNEHLNVIDHPISILGKEIFCKFWVDSDHLTGKYHVFIHDLSKKQEEYLTEILINEALGGAKVGAFWNSFNFNDGFINDVLFGMMGLPNDNISDSRKIWEDCIHEDDRPTVFSQENIVRTGQEKFIELTYRYFHPHKGQWMRITTHLKGMDPGIDGHPRILAGVHNDVTELMQAKELLYRSHEDLKETLDSINEAIITLDTEGRVNLINPVAEQLTGWSNEKAVGKSIDQLIRIDGMEVNAISSVINDVIKSQKKYQDDQSELMISRTGNTFHISKSIAPILSKRGEVLGVVLNFRDVSAEYLLGEKMRQIQFAINNSPGGVYFANEKGEFTFANKNILQILSVGEKDLHKKRLSDLLPNFGNHELERTWSILKDKGYSSIEAQLFDPERGQYPVEIRNYLFTYKGQDSIAAFVWDVSEIKALQFNLEQKNITLEYLVESINGIPWRLDYASQDYTYIGPQVKRILGYKKKEWLTFVDWMSRVHPDDRNKVFAYSLSQIQKGNNFTIQYRMISKSGQEIWIRDIVSVIVDENNKPIELVGFMIDISDLKLHENRLAESRKQLVTLTNSVDSMIYMKDDKGELVLANDSYLDFFHVKRKRAIGRNTVSYMPSSLYALIANDEGEVMKSRKSISSEYEFIDHQGDLKILLTNIVPLINENGEVYATCGNAIDITGRKLQEKKLFELNRKFVTHLQNMPMGYVEVDKDLRILDWNKQAEEIFGYEKHEVLGKLVDDLLVASGENEKIGKVLGDLVKGIGGQRSTNKNITNQGQVIDCEWYNTLIHDIDNESIGWASLVQDVTENLRLNMDLKSAKEEAEEANHAKSAFLANVSHEIRTPMNAIIGFSQLLEKLLKEPLQQNYLNSIRISGKTLLNLINNILDLSKIESGRLTLQDSAVDVDALTYELQQVFHHRVTSKDIKYETILNRELPKYILVDELRLQQILLNLISNALKFTEKGKVTVEVDFELGDSDKEINLKINICDTGIGISEDEMESIFEEFYQQGDQDTKKYGGTGLGLTISKRLVELMGGAISVTSELGVGSCFTIVIPNVKVEYTAVENDIIDFKANDVVFDSARILIADDHESNRRMLGDLLKQNSFEIFEAKNGKDAVGQAVKYSPDLIILDLRMPVMNGYEAVQKMKENLKLNAIPIIALTASVFDFDNDKFKQKGFSSCMTKPFVYEDLVTELVKYLPYRIVKKNLISSANKQNSEICLLSKTKKKELHKIYTTELKNHWELLQKLQKRADLIQFSDKVLYYGNQNAMATWVDYGKALASAVETFDVERINILLNEFLRLEEHLN